MSLREALIIAAGILAVLLYITFSDEFHGLKPQPPGHRQHQGVLYHAEAQRLV